MTRMCPSPDPVGRWSAVCAVVLAGVMLVGRAPEARAQGTPAPPPAPAGAVPPAAAPTPPPNFVYSVDGRRDPFVNMLNRGTTGTDAASTSRRGDGVSALTVEELVVRGIMQSRGALMAMVAGSSGKVFSVKAGDRLADGVIRTVTPQGVVIVQQVNDPLSIEKQREVRKFLRGTEGVK